MGKKKHKSFEAELKAELKQWLRRPMWPADREDMTERQQKLFAESRDAARVTLRWSKKRLASFEKLFFDTVFECHNLFENQAHLSRNGHLRSAFSKYEFFHVIRGRA
jgi:hypothetical protein